MDHKIKLKMLAMTAIMLASLLLFVTASLAWYSISTSPEVSGLQVTLFTDRALLVSADGEDFDQSIDLSEAFKYYASLKPISTVDGVNWFRTDYNVTTGAITGTYLWDNTGKYANVPIYKKDANGNFTDQLLDSTALFEADKEGYYVYCDIWLSTELEEGCYVTLSAPDLDLANLEDWETDEGNQHGAKYGSYALAAYRKDGENVYTIDNNAQTALRVGFLICNEDGTPTDRFVIYEPNADQRGSYEFKPTGQDQYVSGYELVLNPNYTDGSTEPPYLNYLDGTYIPTYPIGVQRDEQGEIIRDGLGNPIGVPTAVDPSKLIIQKRSEWDEEKVRSRVLAEKIPNSNDISSFGRFITNSAVLYNSLDPTLKTYTFTENDQTGLASSSMIVQLKGRDGDTIYKQRIRMFIWLEGQDADCWNDIADGTFVVNLEFAAQTDP